MHLIKATLVSLLALVCAAKPYQERHSAGRDIYIRNAYLDAYDDLNQRYTSLRRRIAFPDANSEVYQPFPAFHRRGAFLEADSGEQVLYERDDPSVYHDRRRSYPPIQAREAYEHGEVVSASQYSKRAPDLDVYIAFGKRRKPDQALHWMIVTSPAGSNDATYYHVTGGPTQNTAFKKEIQAGKKLNSNGIGEKHKIATVKDADKNKIKAAAQSAPLPGTGENCQNYVVNVLTSLEGKHLVPAGTGTHFQAQVEKISRAKTPPVESSTEAVVDGGK